MCVDHATELNGCLEVMPCAEDADPEKLPLLEHEMGPVQNGADDWQVAAHRLEASESFADAVMVRCTCHPRNLRTENTFSVASSSFLKQGVQCPLVTPMRNLGDFESW